MESIVKIKVVLDRISAEYTEKQAELVANFFDKLSAEGIKEPADDIMNMFVNHILVFIKRLEGKEDFVIEGVEEMFSEISVAAQQIVTKSISIFTDKYAVNRAEFFLICTHIENILMNQK